MSIYYSKHLILSIHILNSACLGYFKFYTYSKCSIAVICGVFVFFCLFGGICIEDGLYLACVYRLFESPPYYKNLLQMRQRCKFLICTSCVFQPHADCKGIVNTIHIILAKRADILFQPPLINRAYLL